MNGSNNEIEDGFYDETHPMVKSQKEKDGVMLVWIGLFVMMIGIALFGVAGGWGWLTSLPLGTLVVCTGVTNQVNS